MSIYPTKVPHQGAREPISAAPNAALLIDFDNVTMGMRSDLSKELKNLLNSDIIKGKVTVQRAYADWRRYPQYIVPLSEASIDLIFAPAYGSNKKNATDIRMAIDGIELVFIRPEIGVFILLTGDSDFSSLVLKLKEYGKYVIGVGIQESSSDILVQNCDEYYSYTSLSGLRKTTDSDRQPIDPWVLVERAVEHMATKDDVMRSDRLKQVMVELDPGFDEGEYGFSKFSRFLSEASSKGLLHIRKLENGQHEVAPSEKRDAARERVEEPRPPREERGRGDRTNELASERAAAPRSRGRGAGSRNEARLRRERVGDDTPVADGPPLRAAYDLLTRAIERMLADGREAVRDSDVKRKMLELDRDFDESRLGFSKFSRFLRQAHDHEVIELHKLDGGSHEVTLARGGPAGRPEEPEGPPARSREHVPQATAKYEVLRPRDVALQSPTIAQHPKESALAALGRRFGLLPPRPSQSPAGPPPVSPPFAPVPAPERPEPAPPAASTSRSPSPSTPVAPGSVPVERERALPSVDPASLGLPTDSDAQVRYLTNSYKGVGKKTAEKLVEGLGEDLFTVLREDPERVQNLIPSARAENVLEQWKVDLDRRRSRIEVDPAVAQGTRRADPDPKASGDRTGRAREERGRGREGRQRDGARDRRPRGGRGGPREKREEGRLMDAGKGGEVREQRPAIPEAVVDSTQASSPPKGSAERTVPFPKQQGQPQQPQQSEQPRQQPSEPPESVGPGQRPSDPPESVGDGGREDPSSGNALITDLEGLERSRLHTRTSRGRRR